MIHVAPENISLQISTTGMEISYSELEGLSINLTVKNNSGILARATILFPLVAEFECISMNFYELHHGVLKIDLTENASAVDSHFYRNIDPHSYRKKLATYDPHARFGLAEYFIPGNDSYLRVIGSKYQITETA